MTTDKIPDHKTFADFPEHGELVRKITDLQVRRDQVEQKLRRALAEHQALQEVRDNRQAEARRLLESDKLPNGQLPSGLVSSDELGRLRTESSVLAAAIAMGQERLRQLEAKLAKQCCAPLIPHHRKIIEQLARKMVDVLLLARQEVAIFDALQAEGIPVCELTPSGGPSRPMFLGSLQVNPQDAGNIANWLRQLIEEGVLDGRMAWLRDALALDADPVPRPQPVRPEEPAPTRKKRMFYL